MTLIKSISGIRGTIGGHSGENLTPLDILEFTAAYCSLLASQGKKGQIVVGRDARPSGIMVQELVVQTTLSMGFDVLDLGLSTTPTVEMAVITKKAVGGIIITASHNPVEWNALKFLNDRGEFISSADGGKILEIMKSRDFQFSSVFEMGVRSDFPEAIEEHIRAILDLPVIQVNSIRSRNFKIAVDCINSTGSLAIPPLLKALHCSYQLINDDLSGVFAHNPEPLMNHLGALIDVVERGDFDLGIAVDPDVDRLVLVCHDGSMFGEEYTIVAIADYLLNLHPGPVVSNLSSTQALGDIAQKHKSTYHASAVGEVNVVEKMKEVRAVFGGEGNGGVIYPALHYGRDALVGIALVLSHLAESDLDLKRWRAQLPDYHISKQKLELKTVEEADQLIKHLEQKYSHTEKITIDGLKLIFPGEWVHIRKSNTEPILRIYAESSSLEQANMLAKRFIQEFREIKLNV